MIKFGMPIRRIMELNILSTRDEMGKMAAGDVAQAMNRFIKEKGSVNIVFAAAPSQDEFLAHLAKKRNIDWSRVTCFHLDDYVDLPRNHPNTFEAYLQEHILNRVHPKRIHFLKALQGSNAEVAQKYTRLIEQSGGIHIACIGIGENGHIAFCDPGSDLHDPRMVRTVRIDDRSVRQQ
jgi:glucosamine-6-phosphate deaminase